jgi:triphosphatase
MLADRRYNRFVLSLGRWVEHYGWRNELDSATLPVLLQPAGELANRVLTRLHRKALKRGAHFQTLEPPERHRVRITLKKLRYAIEFFQPLYDDKADLKDYVRHLSRMQNALGHDNDATMTRPLLNALAGDQVSPAVQRAIGVVIGWQMHDRIWTHRKLRKQWRQFKTSTVFWASQHDPR